MRTLTNDEQLLPFLDRRFAAGRGERAKITLLAGAVLLLPVCLGSGQNALAESTNLSASASSAPADAKGAQVILPVSLDTGLDSKKKTAGDEVDAKVASQVKLTDGTVIPRGAKVVGHVTASKAKSKGDTDSSLAIVFDKVDLPGGKTLNIKGSIRAVGPNPNAGDSGGGVNYGGLNQATEHSQTGVPAESVPLLTETSEGAVGIKNLAVDSDGVLRSEGKAVKLEHGAQMMIRAEVRSGQ
jgi:hypothetical protein